MTKTLSSLSYLVFVLACFGTKDVVGANELYRYKDAAGIPVINDRLPPEAVPSGYEILNEEGVVIRVVPPQLTEEELALQSAQEKEAQAEREATAAQKARDELLLMRYSSVADIEAARDRALQSIRIRVSILRSNVRSAVQLIENYQTQAANIERSGGNVDDVTAEAIEVARRRLASTQRALAEREVEIDKVTAEYQADVDRFRHLEDQVEMRRTLSTQD
ncbi:MAG: hypothetical protein P8O79_00905 [Halieaceae bacterium]|nr:hypothetical protein [Halieaceae bacterium]